MRFEQNFFDYFERWKNYIRVLPLNLGGVSSTDGGSGGPPGGFIGFLPQTRVAFDSTEEESNFIPASATLLDNLNRIRYRLGNLEGGTFGRSAWTLESLTPQIPAVGNKFTLSTNITDGSIMVYHNGLAQSLDYFSIDPDFSHITLSFAPAVGDELFVQYTISGSILEGIIIKQGGSVVASGVTVLDFPDAILSTSPGAVTVTFSGIGSSTPGHTIQYESVDYTQRPRLNFLGSGILVEDNDLNNATDITFDMAAITISGTYVASGIPQINITYDSSEIGTLTGNGSLLDNLNHIRWRVSDLETNLENFEFTQLKDAPANYAGAAGKSVVVNTGETGLEFVTISGGGSGSGVDILAVQVFS